MIDQLGEVVVDGLYWVCLAAWRTVPVFVVVMLLSIVLRKRVPPRFLCWLWLLVIVRLLVPVSIPSSMAISDVVDKSAMSLLAPGEEHMASETEFDVFTYRDQNGQSVSVAMLLRTSAPERTLTLRN